jgi:hypothetical protein
MQCLCIHNVLLHHNWILYPLQALSLLEENKEYKKSLLQRLQKSLNANILGTNRKLSINNVLLKCPPLHLLEA